MPLVKIVYVVEQMPFVLLIGHIITNILITFQRLEVGSNALVIILFCQPITPLSNEG